MLRSVFDKLCSEEYRTAFCDKLRNSLNLSQENVNDIIDYIESEELLNDVSKLKQGDYFIKPPRQVFVRKMNSQRRRAVYVFDGKDGYLLKYITFVLQDFDYLHADSLCSFRKDNRSKIFFKNIRRIDPERKLFIVKADFHDFGASIDQDILLEIIEPFFQNDPEFLNFTRWLMTRNQFYRNRELVSERVSIVQGCPLGNFFGNMYLRDLDFVLEAEAVLYMRYTDDIAFMTDSYEKAHWAMNVIREFAQKKKLTINEGKTYMFMPGQEAEILGIQLFDGGFDIGDFAIEKLCSKMRHFCDKKVRRVSYGKCTREMAMSDMICFCNRLFFGKKVNDHELNWVIHAFPIITRIDGLKKIDHCMQNCIRIVGTCKKTDAKYRVRYKDMVKAGYRNLVHAYYHGYELD